MYTSSKQNINKDIAALNNALDQMDLTDIYRAFHLKEIITLKDHKELLWTIIWEQIG